MKKIAIITILLFLGVSCTASKHYGEYTAAQIEAAKLHSKQKPLVDLEFVDSGGKPIKLVVTMPQDAVKVEQVRKNEWVSVVSTGLKSLASVLGIYYVANAVENMFESAGNHSTINTTTTTSTTSNSVSDTDGVVTIGDTNDVDFQPDNSTVDNTVTN